MKNTVTIGFTTYNAQGTIIDALKSAANQTSKSIIQIVAVDDKSTDDTLHILENNNIYPKLEIYQNSSNSGVAVSRNEIIKHANGEFIAFFDDDDISLPNRVEAQLKRILDYEKDFANGAPVICHTARKQIYPDGHERIEPAMGVRLGRPAPAGLKVARRALMGEPLEDAYGSCATCSQMGRTETYRVLGGFDGVFRRCEDSDFAIRLAIVGGHFLGVEEPLVIQKMTKTSEKSLDQLRFFSLLLLEKHQGLFDHDKIYFFTREWIELKYDWLGANRTSFVERLMKLGLMHPVLTAQRLQMAMPNFSGNNAFRRFIGT